MPHAKLVQRLVNHLEAGGHETGHRGSEGCGGVGKAQFRWVACRHYGCTFERVRADEAPVPDVGEPPVLAHANEGGFGTLLKVAETLAARLRAKKRKC